MPSAALTSQVSRSVAQEQRGDLDPFIAAAKRLFVEMNARLAFQVADDHCGQRLTDNQPDRLVVVALEQRPERGLDSPHGAFDRLALGRTDRLGVVDPLPEKLRVPAPDLVDLEPLPESLVEVAEFVDSLGPDHQSALPTISAVRVTFSPGPQ